MDTDSKERVGLWLGRLSVLLCDRCEEFEVFRFHRYPKVCVGFCEALSQANS